MSQVVPPPPTWSSELQKYADDKRKAVVAEPFPRFTRKGKAVLAAPPPTASSLKEAPRDGYDIITNRLPNGNEQHKYESTLQQNTETHVKRGIAKEMSAANHGYNIITMQPRFGMSADAIAEMGGNQENRGKRIGIPHRESDYDVITMQPVREGVLEAEAAAQEAVVRKMARRPQRPTNILSHRYKVDHEARAAAEEEERRRRLDIVADASSSYNPISCKYRRLDKEESAVAAQGVREATRRQVVADHTYKVSTLVGRSEGHAYDIVCNHLYNPDYVLRLEQNRARGVPQRAALKQAWEQQRDVDEALRDSDAQRAVNRISEERTKELLRRGHDILSNKPFGLSQSELLAAGSVTEDATVKEATIRPPKSLSILDEKSVLQKLETIETQRIPTLTTVVRENGPRTTAERVLLSAPSLGSGLDASTFHGRAKLLLPTLQSKDISVAAAESRMPSCLSSRVIGQKVSLLPLGNSTAKLMLPGADMGDGTSDGSMRQFY